MRAMIKIILLVIAAAGLSPAICMGASFYPLPLITEWMQSIVNLYPALNNIFAGFSLLIGLVFLVMFFIVLFLPARLDFLTVKKEHGRLEFSRKAIESTVRCSFADLDEVQAAMVSAKLDRQPEKTKVYVKLSLNNVNEMLALTEKIQERIASALLLSLGTKISSITVKVIRLSSENDGSAIKNKASGESGRVE